MERGGIAAGASRAGLFSPRSGGKGVLRLGFGGLFLLFDTRIGGEGWRWRMMFRTGEGGRYVNRTTGLVGIGFWGEFFLVFGGSTSSWCCSSCSRQRILFFFSDRGMVRG